MRRPPRPPTSRARLPAPLRYLAGLDAERARLDIKTMALEGHEPLWSMGDDTPTPGRGRLDRPVADHLRQAFAQVTNPAIDPERERDRHGPARRARPAAGAARRAAARPADPAAGPPGRGGPRRPARRGVATAAVASSGSTRPGRPPTGRPVSRRPWIGLARAAVAASRGRGRDPAPHRRRLLARAAAGPVDPRGRRRPHGADRRRPARPDRPASPTPPTSSTSTGWRCSSPSAPRPSIRGSPSSWRPSWRARAAPRTLTPTDAIERLVGAFEAGLRKTLARMGISAVASYIGGALVDVIDLDAAVVERCFPTAAAWPGRTTFADLAERQLRRAGGRRGHRADRRRVASRGSRIPGWARFRADGEAHLFAPKIATEIQDARDHRRPARASMPRSRGTAGLAGPRRADRAVPRDELRVRAGRRADGARRGRGRAEHRPALRRLRDERRGAVARGPPGADDRHPARRRRREHRRGRRGPRLVRARPRRPAPRRPDQAGRLGPVRRDRHVPRPRRPARDQDRPGLQARRGRPAPRAQGDRLHRRAPPRPARPELHQPAAAPRHLLDRGPRPAHRRPAGDQPAARGSA